MQGIIGKFFYQFGVTLSLAVVFSYVEAITLAPARCAQFLKNQGDTGQRSFLVDGAFGRMRHSNQGCGVCYFNDYLQRTSDDPLSSAEFFYIGGQNMGQFDAAFWKLREIGARWALPELIEQSADLYASVETSCPFAQSI